MLPEINGLEKSINELTKSLFKKLKLKLTNSIFGLMILL